MFWSKKIRSEGLQYRCYNFATVATGNGWFIEYIRPISIYAILNQGVNCDISFPDVQQNSLQFIASGTGVSLINNKIEQSATNIDINGNPIGTSGNLQIYNQGQMRIPGNVFLSFNPMPIITRSLRLQMSAANGNITVGIWYVV